MKFWFRGHHYHTQIRHSLGMFTGLGGWFYPKFWNYVWFGHEDDCCDYWTPIHLPDGSINPKVKRAFILDDELGLSEKVDDRGDYHD